MPRQTQTLEIDVDGTTYSYTVGHIPPREALKMLTDLAKLVGPTFAAGARALGEGKTTGDASSILEREVDGDLLGQAINVLVRDLNSDAVQGIVDRLCEVTTVDGVGVLNKAGFNKHFGDVGLAPLLKLVPFALRVQYGDFFGQLASVMPTRASFPAPRPATKGPGRP